MEYKLAPRDGGGQRLKLRVAISKPRTVSFSGAVLTLLLSLANNSPVQSQSAAFDHEEFAREVLERHIRPGFAQLAAKMAGLQSTINQACNSRDADEKERVKSAFGEALLAWSRVEHLNFGPANDENRFERIVFWPDRQKIGKRQVARILKQRDPKVLTVAGLEKKSVAVQGLTALEVLLFGKKANQLLEDSPDGQFQCGYALAITANLSNIARDIALGWSDDGDFSELWLKTGKENALYKSDVGPTNQMLKAYKFGLDNVREVKLLGPLGKKRNGIGGPYRKATPSSFMLSGQSISVMIANTQGILSLFDQGGFAERLAVEDPETVELVKLQLEEAIGIAREIEQLGARAFKDETAAETLESMRSPLRIALIAGGEAMTSAAGLVLGFTDDDGD